MAGQRHIRTSILGAVLLFAVTAWPSGLHAAEELSPRYEAGKPEGGTRISAEKLRRLAWGPPAPNGLRAACYFKPTKEAYADGEVVQRRVVFHNSGKEPVVFTVGLGGNDDGWTVMDDHGQEVPCEHVMYLGVVALETFRLQPGEAREIECMSVGMGASLMVADPADTAIQAQPGTTCLVRWTLSVDETKRVERGESVPVAGSWHGTLTTGDVRFRIVEKGGVPR
jgi:hypothetical protein